MSLSVMANMRLRRLLLAVDGSSHSKVALNASLGLAEAFGSEVLTIHSVPTFDEYGVRADLFHAAVQALEIDGRNILDEAAASLGAAAVSHAERLEHGHPVERILLAAGEWRPNLVAVGSRGTSISELYPLGSVSFRTALLSPSSVLVVRPPGKFRRILVPLDRSLGSSEAATWAAALAKRLDASLTLLVVIESDPARVMFTVSRGFAEPFLSKTEERMRQGGVRPARRIRYGDPTTEIVSQATEEGDDLVVMGAKGVTDAPFFSLGGVTSRVIREAPSSVVVVRGNADPGGG